MAKRINTMEELSSEIGISRPTLSKYFYDPSTVRQSTREKIGRALEDVDYVPNFFARNMNRKYTGLIGVVIPHMNDLFYMKLLEEIEKRAVEQDFSIIIQNSHGDADNEIRSIENLRSMNAEGVIVAPVGQERNTREFERLSHEIPLIFVDARSPGLDNGYSFVGNDNQQSIRLMVDYLCRSGTPPIYFSMPTVNSNSIERELVYKARMSELGLVPKVLSDASTMNWDFEEFAYKFMQAKFQDGELLNSTILCANDRLAMGVLRAANEFGLVNQSDKNKWKFRVAGHDDHPLSAYSWPSLTTVSQDIVQIGRNALDMMVAKSRKHDAETIDGEERLFQAQLILRDSA